MEEARPADEKAGRFRRAARAIGWRRAGIFAAVFLLAMLIPPVRRATANTASRVILFVASPLAPDISGFDTLPQTSTVMAKDGSEIGALGEEKRETVDLQRLPEHVERAVLAAEDASFYEHSGVDPSGVVRALFNNIRGGGTQGGSTITQQLAKLNYAGTERTLFRKLREVLYASKLERKYSKDELLQRYLNQVYFGQRSYGLAVAARTFFAASPEALTPAQAATLAGKIRSPERLNPYTKPDAV
ncbi:MAG TPA: biosynthetic peptidoglycan transglycosylase, partial [Actinomycetota bacterium]|nr:biosynthetic peptidoglycan transglycosylase [Actinomycetota bacterium]